MIAPRHLMRSLAAGLILAAGLGSLLLVTGDGPAHSQPPQSRDLARPPATVRTLRSFGAIGDGKSDDSAAVRKAVASSARVCLDGEGRSYSVRGTIRASNDLCLRDATLVQAERGYDSRRYVQAACPLVTDPAASVDCGDRPLSSVADLAFLQSLSTRTLFVRPAEGHQRLKVWLTNVKVDRGPIATNGSRGDSAGIWLDGADLIDLQGVEVTGMGRGFGLMIADSQNVRIRKLNMHDLSWAPYPADLAAINLARLEAGGWNNATVREYRADRPRGPGFVGVRVQEQLSCVFLTRVRHVQIENLTIRTCVARVGDKLLAWQTDGLAIGSGVSDISVDGGIIDTSWEGIDIGTADNSRGFTVRNLKITNAFSFAIKVGYRLSDVLISDVAIANAGLEGIDLRGAVHGAVIERTTIDETGVVNGRTGLTRPWPVGSQAGIRLQRGNDGAQPQDVTIRNVRIQNPKSPGAYAIGIRTDGTRSDVRLFDVHAQDFRRSQVQYAP